MNQTYVAFDTGLIWGQGPTPEAALEAGRQNYDDGKTPLARIEERVASLKTAIATPVLLIKISESGGNVSFHMLPDGRIGAWEEWEEVPF